MTAVGTSNPTRASTSGIIASAGTHGFNVAGIADVRLWWDASESSHIFSDASLNTLAVDNGPVRRWRNKAGNGVVNAANTGADSVCPTYRAKCSHNNKPGIYFDGGDTLTFNDGITLGGNVSLFVAAAAPNTNSNGQVSTLISLNYFSAGTEARQIQLWGVTQGAGVKTYIAAAQGQNGSRSTISFRNNQTDVFVSVQSNIPTVTNTTQSASVVLGSESEGYATVAYNATRHSFNSASTIGALSNGLSYLAGTIHEIVVILRAVSTDERDNIVQYLRRKWY